MSPNTKMDGIAPALTSDDAEFRQTSSKSDSMQFESHNLQSIAEASVPRAHDTTTPDEMRDVADTARFFAGIPDIVATACYTVIADDAAPGVPFTARVGLPGCAPVDRPGFATMPGAHRWIRECFGDTVFYVTPVAFSAMVGESEASL